MRLSFSLLACTAMCLAVPNLASVFNLTAPKRTAAAEEGQSVSFPFSVTITSEENEERVELDLWHYRTKECSVASFEKVCSHDGQCVEDLRLPLGCHYSQGDGVKLVEISCDFTHFQKGHCADGQIAELKARIAKRGNRSSEFSIEIPFVHLNDSGIYSVAVSSGDDDLSIDFVLTVVEATMTTPNPTSASNRSTPVNETLSTVPVTPALTTVSESRNETETTVSKPVVANERFWIPQSMTVMKGEGPVTLYLDIVDNMTLPQFNVSVEWFHMNTAPGCKSLLVYSDCLTAGMLPECLHPANDDGCVISSFFKATLLARTDYFCGNSAEWKTRCPVKKVINSSWRDKAEMDGQNRLIFASATDAQPGFYVLTAALNGRYESAVWNFVLLIDQDSAAAVQVLSGYPKEDKNRKVHLGPHHLLVSVICIIAALFATALTAACVATCMCCFQSKKRGGKRPSGPAIQQTVYFNSLSRRSSYRSLPTREEDFDSDDSVEFFPPPSPIMPSKSPVDEGPRFEQARSMLMDLLGARSKVTGNLDDFY
ncbi:F-gE [Chelonid alphaherpesvirus 5]|uniref:Envelope glycoprotein E n=1 Tax=Chelonid alphaherpesvirus 5 TaxID=702736 RepID=V5NWF5_9ALPH|nr:F-gE [Chelonid alphaherpesvirus 5]AHA93301.1 F-gE [Chelonid alphaherpesvirus 5]